MQACTSKYLLVSNLRVFYLKTYSVLKIDDEGKTREASCPFFYTYLFFIFPETRIHELVWFSCLRITNVGRKTLIVTNYP